ncbi:MAG: hypothetical protein EHM46_06120, partial [Bacteroidetes bacterium]
MKPKQKELNPYLGPRPFERTDEDSKRFFGRDRETDEIVSLIFSHPLLLVYAQSGAGKTSLLNAGIAPALEKRDFNVFPIVRVGGAIPEQVNIDDISNVYVFNALMSLEPESPPKRLIDKTLTAFLKAIPRVASASGRLSPRALIFDQFEEIFTLYQKDWQDQQRAFFIQVSDALNDDPLLRVIFVIREEYLAQLDPFTRLLPEKLKTRFRLERLQEEAALQAIKEPVRNTGRHFAKGVAEQLVSDLLKVPIETPARVTVEIMGKFVEPVQLQMVCDRIWRNLKPGDQVISHELLRETGDVNRTLSEFYESSLKEAIQATGIGEDTLRKWFEQTLITPSGTRGTAFKGLTETGGIPNEIVEVLEKARLIRLEVRAGSPWCELSHDRFIVPIQKSNERWKKKQHELDEYSYMVQFYKANGNYGEAARVLQKTLEIEPTQQAYTELGEIHRLNGDHDRAIENLKIAMDLN